MPTRKYKTKPSEVEARQFKGSPSECHVIYRWVEQNTLGSFEPLDVIECGKSCPANGVTIDPRDGRMVIATRQRLYWVNIGDYVLRDESGDFYPVAPSLFEHTFYAVS